MKCKTSEFISKCRQNGILPSNNHQKDGILNNTDLKSCLAECQNALNSSLAIEKFSGGNSSLELVVSKVDNTEILIPPNCRFYNDDIHCIHEIKQLDETYDLIVMDPPWWNKFVRRTKQFSPNNG